MYNEKESTEDYLEKILLAKKEYQILRATDLAKFMGFSKPSVSVALKKLKEKGYVEISNENGDISLTAIGEERASSTYSKHTLLTTMFKNLGVDEKTAEEDACKIEHLLSDETYKVLSNHFNVKKN